MYEVTMSPQYYKTVQQRVQKGVRFLRKIKGKDWYKSIKLKVLNLDSTTMCVLGQAFAKEAAGNDHDSGFGFAVDSYDIVPDECGFDVPTEENETFDHLNADHKHEGLNPWTILGDVWVEAIAKEKKKVRNARAHFQSK